MGTNFSTTVVAKLNDALALFKACQYFECHELLESHLWLNEPDIKQKQFYQGLIHLAVAQHHLAKGNLSGYRLQIQKAAAIQSNATHHQQAWFQAFKPLDINQSL